jgi:hypothetical protein
VARRILAAVAGDRYQAAFALAFIGLREGEILGLAWQDVNLDTATAAVCYELSGSGEHATRHQRKTEASEATVPLPPFVVERLRAHLDRQHGERPDAANDDGLVFVTPRGYAVNGSWLTKHFQALLDRAGLQRMRLHDLRHGAASLLVGAGVHPRIAQELLRHASSKTTMEIYSHVSAAQQREAVEVLQRALAESHLESHLGPDSGGQDWAKAAETGQFERESWLRRAGAGRVLNPRRTATSEIVLPHPVRSREWLKLALLECQRCHQFVERRSPIQRHCPDCTRMLRNERSRRAVARRRHEHP